VCILATSREPLGVRGEQVHRLSALETPDVSHRLTAPEALSFSAIDLFRERAAACAGYELTDEDVPIVADICRKTDGIALAIELAATRVDSLALSELSALLSGRLDLLNRGRRTAPERHRSLIATLDWSYDLLPAEQRALFRHLSVFDGAFALESAIAVTSGDPLTQADVVEGLAELVAKSLVEVDTNAAVARYRLLNTTKAYALQKLQETGEHVTYQRRHAEYHPVASRKEFV
jgi:predicted ATPase